MALVTCPHCAAQTTDLASACDYCGQPVKRVVEAPIKKLSGKLSAAGAIIVTMGVIGTILGTWWGPVTVLPGVAIFLMAKFL